MQNNLIDLINIDRRSRVDYALQVKDNIKALVLDKTFCYRAVLPTTLELASHLEIDVEIVEDAYSQLQKERYIHRNDDQCTVSHLELTEYFFDKNTTIHEAIIALGLLPSIKCLDKKVVKLSSEESQAMGFDESIGSDFLYINRLYLGNDQPIIVLENYLPLSIFKGMDKSFKGTEPLNDYLKTNYGFGAKTSIRKIKVVNLSKELSKILNERPNMASIQSTNNVFDSQNRMIDYGQSHAISSYYFHALITKEELNEEL